MFCLNSCKSTSICLIHIPINILGWMDGLQWMWWIGWVGWKSYGNHMTTMWGTCANCVQSMCKPCVHENHMRAVSWWSQIRNPKIKPGLPDEYQDMVIKECQLQGRYYLLQKCILHLHNLHVFHPIHPINPSHPSQDCANHVQTIWKPHKKPVGAMWKPHKKHCGGYGQACEKPYEKTMCKPCANHLENTWKPSGGHVQTMCKPCANHVHSTWNHVGAMWKPHANHVGEKPGGDMSDHVQTMWKPHENHGAMWKPHEKHCGGHGQA